MKGKVKTIGFVVGVDCANQPIVVEHHLVSDTKEMNADKKISPASVKNMKSSSFSTKHSKTKCHCGQSQKNIRMDHK